MNRENAAKKKKQAAAAKKKEKKTTGEAKGVPKKVVSRTELAQLPSTPSPLPVVPPVFTEETPSPTQGRGDATVAGSSFDEKLAVLEERLSAQWEFDIGEFRTDILLLLRNRVEIASRLDEMRDRLDAFGARLRELEPRRERAPSYPTVRMRYRSRSRSRSRSAEYMERERPRYSRR